MTYTVITVHVCTLYTYIYYIGSFPAHLGQMRIQLSAVSLFFAQGTPTSQWCQPPRHQCQRKGWQPNRLRLVGCTWKEPGQSNAACLPVNTSFCPTNKPASKQTSEQASKPNNQTNKRAGEQASNNQTNQQASKQASEQANKQASKQPNTQPNKGASKQKNNQTKHQTNKQASKQGNKLAIEQNKQASKHARARAHTHMYSSRLLFKVYDSVITAQTDACDSWTMTLYCVAS